MLGACLGPFLCRAEVARVATTKPCTVIWESLKQAKFTRANHFTMIYSRGCHPSATGRVRSTKECLAKAGQCGNTLHKITAQHSMGVT